MKQEYFVRTNPIWDYEITRPYGLYKSYIQEDFIHVKYNKDQKNSEYGHFLRSEDNCY